MEIGNDGKSIATEQNADLNLSKESSGYQRAPKLASISSQSSSLTNEQLTAHLTEEERQILQKVWQKEEEFALKKLVEISQEIWLHQI
ncbi:hypothetical protein QR98_0069190 [Sarcoptes scabiei]|uniref:Uncharacterized protein n=1 Tax=Sarcoptes scabiei TaxID=52283 RepID=A0A132ABP4_SARSC|nr:hypothetical protein QR98_0069190 [Sarcoptes scabiei]